MADTEQNGETPPGRGTDIIGPKESHLIRRAIRERWPIPEEKRAEVINGLIESAMFAEDVRSRIAAGRALIAADALNMEQEKRDLGIADKLEVTGKDGEPLIQFYIPQNNRDKNPSANGTAGTVPIVPS